MSRTTRRNPSRFGWYWNRYRVEDELYIYGDGTHRELTNWDRKHLQGRDGIYGYVGEAYSKSPNFYSWREIAPGASRRFNKKLTSRYRRIRDKAVVREHLLDYIEQTLEKDC